MYFQFVLFTRFIKSKFKMISFRGKKKGRATPKLVAFRGLIQNSRRESPSLSYGSTPLGTYASTYTQNVPVELSARYQKNFIRER